MVLVRLGVTEQDECVTGEIPIHEPLVALDSLRDAALKIADRLAQIFKSRTVRPRCVGILSRRRLSPGMRDHLAHSSHDDVHGAVSHSPPPSQIAAVGLRRCADAGGGARPGWSAIRAGRRRAEPMDGSSVASRYGELSLRLRPRLRSVSADILAGASSQSGPV